MVAQLETQRHADAERQHADQGDERLERHKEIEQGEGCESCEVLEETGGKYDGGRV